MYNIKRGIKKTIKKTNLEKIHLLGFMSQHQLDEKKNEKKVLLTGATALTRTPELAHSMDKDLVRLSTAERAAPVWLSGT